MGNLHQNQQTNNHGQSGPTISDKPGYRFTFIEKSTEQIPRRKWVYIKEDLVDLYNHFLLNNLHSYFVLIGRV